MAANLDDLEDLEEIEPDMSMPPGYNGGKGNQKRN